MSLVIPEKLPDCIDEPVKNAVNPLAINIGKTMGDLWFLALGGISQCAEKKKLKYAIDLEKFKNSLEEKIESIPAERRIEPNTQIVCQALEDAKFCAENEQIREMFASLIASTMDNQTSCNVHPSFSGLLKQLSPLDALVFSKIKPGRVYPIKKAEEKNSLELSFNKFVILDEENVFLKDKNTTLSFEVLLKQGLIRVIYESNEMEKRDYDYVVVERPGRVYLTHLGYMFYKCCLGDEECP